MGLGIPEIVIIGLAIVVLLFGGKKVVELARGLGRATGEFKKAKREVEDELAAGAKESEHSSSDQTNQKS